MKNKNIFFIAWNSIRFAWKANKQLFVVLIILNIFQGSVVYLQLTSFSAIVDEIVKMKQGLHDASALTWASAQLGFSFLIPTLLSNVVTYNRTKFRQQLDVRLDMYKIEKQSSLDIATIESTHYQNLLRSAQEWGTGSVLTLQDFVFSSANNFAGIITSVVILWTLNSWLVLFAVLAAAPVYFFYKKHGLEVFRIRWFAMDDQRIITNRTSHFENLQKAVDVILLKLKDWFKGQIEERMLEYNKKVLAAERKKSIAHSFLSLWYLLFLFSAIFLMTRQALDGQIAVGVLLLAFTTYTRFYQTVNAYIESISFTEEAARYAARWFELLDLHPNVTSSPKATRVKFEEPPSIEFKNVSFHYPSEKTDVPGTNVLNNISFTINSGEKLAITGINGSGKTTLIKLLCRVYEPSEGSIEINGVNLKDIDLEDWQKAIGVLFQDFPIYNLKIRESIGVGRISDPDYRTEEKKLKKAARLSGCEEFINEFSSSYDQLIWKEFKDGTDLSRGQHQRLAVARMLYRDAMVTILDEPTAAIDAVTEERIFDTLEKNMHGKTIILITHRFSSVRNVDKILYMENGRIAEQGRHAELMKVNGKYATLYSMQASRYFQKDAVASSPC